MDDVKQLIKECYNWTYSGIAAFYRDTTLSKEAIDKYTIGKIIKEKAFVDFTPLKGGIVQNTRFFIASSNGRIVYTISPEVEKWKMCMLQTKSYFKILDIFCLENKTQILLLHIPEKGVEFFAKVDIDDDKEIIKIARNDFEKCIKLPPLPVLQEKIWIERTKFPLGLDDDNNLFPL